MENNLAKIEADTIADLDALSTRLAIARAMQYDFHDLMGDDDDDDDE